MGSRRRFVAVAGLATVMAMVIGCGSQIAGAPQAGPPPASPTIESTRATSAAPVPPTRPTEATPSGTSIAPTEQSTLRVSTPSTAPSSTAIKTFLPDPPGGSKKNEYGDIVAKPGQTYGLYLNDEKTVAFVFQAASIQLDKGCVTPADGGAAAKPENGHFVVVELQVDLRNVTQQDLKDQGIDFSRSSWEAFDAHGNPQTGVHSDAGNTCAGEHDLGFNDPPRSGQLNSGLIVLDVEAAKGTVLFKTAGLSNGWEYAFG